MNQLYNLQKDKLEMKNHAENPEYKEILDNMKKMLGQELKTFNRPYGEFVPGGDALPYIEQNNLKDIISKALVTLAEERVKMKKMAKKK
ncbi:MAG: hypothetical protein MK132_02630 [Lentisphaerales bacterium]|nr:hypothetical protein [Lentisphaerales bacterium]